MSTSNPKRAAWLLCTLTLVGVLAAPKGLVLCVGEDGGHIAIETAVELTPCGVPIRDGSTFGAPPVEACRDTALVQTALRPSVDPEIATPIATAAPLPLPASCQAAPLFRRAAGPRLASLTLRAHRTVVLLV